MRLKQATAPLHQRIDTYLAGAGFLDSQAAYGDYLVRTLGAREAVEAQLDRSGAEQLYAPWPRRRIAAALRQDLADLSLAAEPPSVLEPLDRAGMLGALYVLEGASAGARLIARRVGGLGVHAGFGARHLSVQTEDASAFRSFVALLDAAELSETEEAACRTAAIATFEAFERSYTAIL